MLARRGKRRSGRYASRIFNAGVGSGIRYRFGNVAFKSFSAEVHAILWKMRYLQFVEKYFTGH